MICAYQDQWREANSTISFDNITIEYPPPPPRTEPSTRNNSDSESEVEPTTMELESGTFICPLRGFYRATFSGGADRHPGKVTYISLSDYTTGCFSIATNIIFGQPHKMLPINYIY